MRAYRALLRLFPASFQREYADEMCAIFARRMREAGAGDALSRAVLWIEAVADVFASAMRAHADLLRQDLRYSARTFRRAPGFVATAILVTALGIGATTATFSITDHVLVRPLPFPDAGRIVRLWQAERGGGWGNELSPANYRDWKAMSSSFEGMGTYRTISVNLVGGGEPMRIDGAALTEDLLPLLGVRPALGRSFNAADTREGAPATVILSHGLWRSRFAADHEVVGRTLRLDDATFTVIGVMPPDFHFPNHTHQLWTTLAFAADAFEDRTDTFLYVVARLRKDVSIEQARAEMELVAARLERAYPRENVRVTSAVVALRDHVSTQQRVLLKALVGAALCVLLVACTNLAGLLFARGVFRRKELAVRSALGAGRERLVRQLLTESLLISAFGGALGVALALSAMPLVARLVPNVLPIAEVPVLDARVLTFAALITVLTGIGFGVLPALRASRDTSASGLREGGRGGLGGRSERLRGTLVIAEVTASVVLLVSAGLLIRALWRVQAIDPGFRADNVLTLRTTLPLPRYEKAADRLQFYERVLQDVRSLPGVSGAAYASGLPMVMRGGIWAVRMTGKDEVPAAGRTASLRFVTPGYFAALGIPLLRGRDVAESDVQAAQPVAVVSASFVKQYWPGEDALGRTFHFAVRDRTIVGVVGDVRVRGLERTNEPQIYLSYRQFPDGEVAPHYLPKDLAIRASTDAMALMPAVRRAVAAADPQQPISDVSTLAEVVAADTAPRAVQVRVLGGFAAVAVLLAGFGIYGLLAFTVSQRMQEIGVRLALGAVPRDILGLVLGQGARLAAVGVLIGVPLAYATAQLMRALLAGVSPRDGAAFLGATAVALVTAMAGCLWPALRAARVDPLTVIRTE